jgi:hypothetical protein
MERSLTVQLSVSMPDLLGLKLPTDAASVTLAAGEFRNLL